MKKYRRIEVNAFRRRVTVVSGEWRTGDLFDSPTTRLGEGVSLNEADECEPVAPDSPEGQLILVEAVRTLERRLTPETRALIGTNHTTLAPIGSNPSGFFLSLQSSINSLSKKLCAVLDKEK